MSHQYKISIQNWLDLELSKTGDREAEKALGAVFGLMTLASPSAAFLGRVVADVKRSRDIFSRAWAKGAIAASLALLAIALGMLPVSLLVLGKTLGLAALVDMASRGLLLIGDGIVRSLSIWRGMAELGEAATVLAASPVGIWALIVVSMLLGISVLLFRGLLVRSLEMSS